MLNLVRLRYDESPVFLHVGDISSSKRFSSRGSLTGTIFFPGTGGHSPLDVAGSAAAEYGDNPIFNYVPFDDERYTKQLLRPLSLKSLALLLQSSWSISRVFRLAIQQTGSVLNSPSSARSTPSYPPEYKDFSHIVNVLRRMQRENSLTVRYVNERKHEQLIISIRPYYPLYETDKRLLVKYGIKISHNDLIFSSEPWSGENYISTRSVLGILHYLSKGLIVPPDDEKRGVLTITRYLNGSVFNWQLVLGQMMTIKTFNEQPSSAIVSIFYRGRWYYIDERDSNSKKTLILLSNVVGLIATSSNNEVGNISLTRLS